MVLAAGVGSRLDPLTAELPKPLVPVANVPVMEHIVRLLKEHGFTDICANVHYLPEKIEQYFGNGDAQGVSLTCHREEQLSGDAGGVRACREFFGEGTFIVLSGDLITDVNLTALVKEHKKRRALASIALKRVDDVSHFGVAVLNESGFIMGFQEKPKPEVALSNLVSTGIYILETEIFKYIPLTGQYGFGRQLFPHLIKEGLPILGVEFSDYWSDVGTIEQYRISNFDALAHKAKLTLPGRLVSGMAHILRCGEGALVEAPDEIEGNLIVGKNSVIKRGAKIKGSVVVGDNCVIHSGAEVVDSVIWSCSEIMGNAKVINCVIGSNCVISSGKKLEGTARIASGLSEQELAV